MNRLARGSLTLIAFLFANLLGTAGATAQTASTVPDTPGTPAPDSALAAYVGTWDLVLADSVNGDVPATLTVAADGTGTLSVPSLDVTDATVSGLGVVSDSLTAAPTLAGETTFRWPSSGRQVTSRFVLSPADNGTLAGRFKPEHGPGYALTARRAAR